MNPTPDQACNTRARGPVTIGFPKLRQDHLDWMRDDVRPVGAALHDQFRSMRADVLGPAWAAVLYDGAAEQRVLGVGGLIAQWPTRAIAWALPYRVPRRWWPAITRKVVAVLEDAHADGVVRIEAHVTDDDPSAQEWAVRLGFVPESDTPARCWCPDLRDAWPLVRLAPQLEQKAA
jgi:hypothetical protein